ncbi:glycosyltransferase family 2 protein [Noviherbaspirillum aridicola]|uniref:Glycosyltransferase 2-like domain-containing protein n=1 Tax=Noviherbaspirillum aridicola TaxID=2849687 RepID=A0ABQ4QAJ0_9BURK|nr:glycosyltransferase family A protein [Noviherbaspirillum aridicola]GIZ54006.1 hypothetical protein NCCP691_40200 [Noviherbaspirillum aridicola]
MHQPLLSLVVATVGRTAELAGLFASLAAQSWRGFEVIVVDQNGDDRLDAILAQARQEGLALSHLRLQPANLSAARNLGIDAARGEWIGFPDDDCWYSPHMLERLAKYFEGRQPAAGVAARWHELIDASEPASRLSWRRSRAFRDVPTPSFALFFHRAVFQRIGGFDARLGVGQWFGAGEETDLLFRALRTGAVIEFEPSAVVHHPLKEPPPTADARHAERLRARGAGALYRKHALPPWVILRGLLAPVLRPLSQGRFGNELALGRAVMRGRLDGVLGWGRGGGPIYRSTGAARTWAPEAGQDSTAAADAAVQEAAQEAGQLAA